MSFGWSAGDIAAAITLAYNLIQALDTCDGAAGDYREAVSFLQDLKRTLEPLQAFTASDVVPGYGSDIEEQVAHIKEPVEVFLVAVLKYEPSLGVAAKAGHHRHIFRKLQWYMFMSKKVLSLRRKIESHMHIIDTLMRRLTIDSIRAVQQQLPDVLRATLQQTLRPELIAILQENLPPLNANLLESYRELQRTSLGMSAAKWTEQYESLSIGIRDIKEDIGSSCMTQMRIESSLRGHIPRHMGPALPAPAPAPEQPGCRYEENEESMNQNVTLPSPSVTHKMVRESLREVYYFVFLYLGHFLKNLFLVLSRLVQPTQTLMPVLLAQYNISFLDAFGRPPRILPFEYFRSFKVLQAFIEHEFRDFPGSAMVDRGKYLILNLANSRILDESNWSGYVAPGSTVAMSMVVHKRLKSSNSQEDRCPESSCPGTWTKPETQSWVTCPICQKQILTFPATNLKDVEEIAVQRSLNHSFSLGFPDSQYSRTSRSIHPTRPEPKINDIEPELEEDISSFKRIVQEITDLQCKRSRTVDTTLQAIIESLARFKLVDRAFIAAKEHLYSSEPVGGVRVIQGLKCLHDERLAFEKTVDRLLSLALDYSKLPTPGSSSIGSLEDLDGVVETISGDWRRRLGLHLSNPISDAVMETSRTLDEIQTLIPGGIVTIVAPYKHCPEIEMFGKSINDATRCFPLLVDQNRKFEKSVILAEDLLQWTRTESLLRDFAGASTSPPDSAQFSSDDEDFEESKISERGKEHGTDISSPPFLTSKNSERDTLSVDEYIEGLRSFILLSRGGRALDSSM